MSTPQSVSVVTICETCKQDNWADSPSPETHGEQLAALVEAAARNVPNVETRRHACLMGCTHACNVALQAQGKLAYTLGRFEPTQEAAEGIVAYAALHATSETGQVPFREWPQAIKGHFITRHPPLPQNE